MSGDMMLHIDAQASTLTSKLLFDYFGNSMESVYRVLCVTEDRTKIEYILKAPVYYCIG